ncbi:phosphonate metabolism protein/1,5-bisphosphokinase (PRPP-forming) PhnN [Gymnodinialimonas sp. 2305UL16-5]|uniref:phosphonate metabolism protein/1,5-bisphosphokinase (PRPP-forming) PhnN n=1 Tax=Gymnodinialimonas mytili TaxID=3126503 RepID=UPI0030A64170
MSVLGRFIAVVGPSGVGKDSLMAALCVARPDLHQVRRVITRAPDAGGEDYESTNPALFAARAAGGEFALHWRAHDLHYGIPASVEDVMAAGQDAMANLSRGMLGKAQTVFPMLHVLSVTAARDVLERRLSARGRESRSNIARRLARPAPALPEGIRITLIDNSGPLHESVAAALGALYPERV